MNKEKLKFDIWDFYAFMDFVDRMNISLVVKGDVILIAPPENYCEHCNEPYSIYDKTCPGCKTSSGGLLKYWENYQKKDNPDGSDLLREEPEAVRRLFSRLFGKRSI
ncbi:MAG: hypothetical protein ACE5OZ_01570 [Candidatus Heimdallarchaeota archaeon]